MPEYTHADTLDTITNDVTVSSGKKIDGVDLSAHIHNTTDGSSKVTITDLTGTQILNPSADEVLKYNGVDWVNSPALVAAAGLGISYYFNGTASDISNYETLTRTASVVAEHDDTAIVNNNTVLIEEYSTASTGLGLSQVDAGDWTFNIYNSISATDGTTTLIFKVYKRTSGGVETLLFTAESPELTSLTPSLTTFTSTQPVFTIGETDRGVIKVSAKTTHTSNITVHFYHSGTVNTSSVLTPFRAKHNDLAGLEGGNGEFYHLTQTEYTGTGTGVFVRKDGATLTGTTTIGKLGFSAIPTDNYRINIHNGNINMSNIAPPTTAPTVSLGAAGVLTGDYYYNIAYLSIVGETETGAISGKISPSSQKVELTNIPISPDSDVTSREIYRTTAGGDPTRMHLVYELLDNTTTTYTDNTADVALDAESEHRINTTGGLIFRNGKRVMATGHTTTSLGSESLNNGTGYYNTAIGAHTLKSNTDGQSNTAVGYHALESNTTGSGNVAMGDLTLDHNTTGKLNTAVGSFALTDNTTGNNNTALGNNALISNINGSNNTVVGDNAAHFHTSGNNNTAIGINTLYNNTTGENNTAVGAYVLVGVASTGSNNTAVGNNSMSANITGQWNIAVGRHTLDKNTTGSDNTAVGNYACWGNTSGIENVAVGNNAGSAITTGNNNTFIGNNTGQSGTSQVATVSNSTAIGNGAYTTASNQVVIGNTSVTTVTINGSIQSPTIVTPIIASFVNAQHDHTNAANGGSISANFKYGEAFINNNITATTVQTANIPVGLFTGIESGELNGFTFKAGTSSSITAYADAGSGKVLVTSTNHGLLDTEIITIRGTTNYNGIHTVSNSTTNTFTITTTWVANDGTSTFVRPAYLIAGASTSGKFSATWQMSTTTNSALTLTWRMNINATPQAKSTAYQKYVNNGITSCSSSAILNISPNDRIWLSVENTTTASITNNYGEFNLRSV